MNKKIQTPWSTAKFSATLAAAVSFQLLLSLIYMPVGSCEEKKASAWPKTFPGYHVLSTQFVDLDKDGEKEVIVGLTPSTFDLNRPVSEYTHVEAYSLGGSLLWTSDPLRPYLSSSGSPFAVGEVDGDGFPEIVLGLQASPLRGDHSAVFVLDHKGKVERGWPALFEPAAVGQPMLADLNKDGVCEILFSHSSGVKGDAVSAYRGDGTLLWTKASPLHYKVKGMAVGDINHDGSGQEIAVGYAAEDPGGPRLASQILVLNADGSDFGKPILIPLSKNDLALPRLSAPTLGDLDGDGDLEIVVSSAETRGGALKTHAFRYDGASLSGFPEEAGVFSVALPAPLLADVDVDRTLEVFTFTETAIYGWNSKGDALRGWPVTLDRELQNPKFLAITDVHGDKNMEILFTSADSIVQSLNADGSKTSKVPTRVDPAGIAMIQATFGSLGSESDLYMGASTTNSRYLTAKVFLVKLDVSRHSKGADWPMAGHDLQLTGRAGVFTNPPVFSPAIPAGRSAKIGSLFTHEVKAKDPDGDSLTYAIEGRLPSGADFSPQSRILKWTPKAGQSGSYAVTFAVSDDTHTTREKMEITVSNEQAVLAESESRGSRNKDKDSENKSTETKKSERKTSDTIKTSVEDTAENSDEAEAEVESSKSSRSKADRVFASGNMTAVSGTSSTARAAAKVSENAMVASPQFSRSAADRGMVGALVASPQMTAPRAAPAALAAGRGMATRMDLPGRFLVAAPQTFSAPNPAVKMSGKINNPVPVFAGRYVSPPGQSKLRGTEEAPRLVSVAMSR